MIAAFFSGSATERHSFVARFIGRAEPKLVIYVCPKNAIEEAKASGIQAYFVAFEDMTKTEQWLRLNAMIGPHTALVMENVTRYPRITSDKFRHLQRLSMQVPHRCLVDIVPFTLGIEYLYTPFSYLDRSILGFAHWYSFRENNKEQMEDGTIVQSHDHTALALKIATVAELGVDTILKNRCIVSIKSSQSEHTDYQVLRNELFSKELSPSRIVTKLADRSHAFASRMDSVIGVTGKSTERCLVLTNLKAYADKYRRAFTRHASNHDADSFELGSSRTDLATFDHLIYAEHPIANSYFALDIEARCRRDAQVSHVCADVKVCGFLYRRYREEIDAIQSLTAQLRRIKNA